jgi:hypothetical protein
MYQVLLRPAKLGTRDRWMEPDPNPWTTLRSAVSPPDPSPAANPVQEGGKPQAGRAVPADAPAVGLCIHAVERGLCPTIRLSTR